MKLGTEIFTRSGLIMESGRFIETWLRLNDHLIEESAGRDEYKRKLFFPKGSRVAATGRLNIWDLPQRLRLGRVRPAWPVNLDIKESSCLSIEIRTNISQNYLEFVRLFSIKLVEEHDLVLYCTDLDSVCVKGRWPQRGRYVFHLPDFKLI